MGAEANNSRRSRARLDWVSSRLSLKLMVLLGAALALVFGLTGYVHIRLHRQQLDASTLHGAELLSNIIKRSASHYMLYNDRHGLYQTIETVASEPGVESIRIFNGEGRISFSTVPSEVNHLVDKKAEACYGCHSQASPLIHLNRPDRFRIYTNGQGKRVLGIINPIVNQPSCSTGACHAHPASQKILGVLDTNLSLSEGDRSVAEGTQQMLVHTLVAVGLISLLMFVLLWRSVHNPLHLLKVGTEKLTGGELGYQIRLDARDELGELADSFNRMSRQLKEAHEQITAWNHTLEERVEKKTAELKRVHEQILHVEKMVSIGKMAAIVAHEINNPLSGILTYAKLVRKWLNRDVLDEARREECRASLQLIESESKRCGEIVKNLLTFARVSSINMQWKDLGEIFSQVVRLVQHQAELNNVRLELESSADLPKVLCDPTQIEQVVLALLMNALEASSGGGTVRVSSGLGSDRREVHIKIQDDGPGIPADVLPKLFEPFFTAKESGRGVGLGLAISRGIVERHGGRIEVESEPGQGTVFTVIVPVDSRGGPEAAGAPGSAAVEPR
ncbi:MAG: HAMP domain-containing protein [Candidatus Riflebacteria bacterium]|nr:HAMP domain-containing protein [Candidatus Riflebacteria bacterium]